MTGDSFTGPTAVQYGDGNTQHNYFQAPREEVAWPLMVGVVPARAGAFQNRAEGSRLREAAAEGATVVPCQVLTGMGGVGKTQLAADYAVQAWDDGHGVDLLLWVTASSRDAVVAAFADAGTTIRGTDPADPQRAAAGFLTWLRVSGSSWLIVLDDVADPADLTGLWPPQVAHGRTVVTTRRRDHALSKGGGRQRVDVGLFTPAQAVAYLAEVLQADGRTEPDGELAGLTGDLGHLPLALSQAAAYITDADITVSHYRELLTRHARTLEALSPDTRPDEQPRSMAAVWELSVDYADRLRPLGLARPMLELVAFLAPNGTPLNALTSGPALDHLTRHRTPPREDDDPAAPRSEPVTQEEAEGALRALHRLSLLTAPGTAHAHADHPTDRVGAPAWDGRLVRVHQLVQRATRDTLPPARHDHTARTAAGALTATWPDIERDTTHAQALRACTTALTTYAEPALHHSDAYRLLVRAGRSLGESGQVAAAVSHFQHLVDTSGKFLGPDHPDSLTTRHNLAHFHGEAGDPARAAAALAELLKDQLRVLSTNHPYTLATRHSLAHWRREARNTMGAPADAGDKTS
ncbi:tetratricopeptide repeat protein [Actinacidiphila sp. bgisy144]|uniref:tetratricopeptide repeat protein n=1 Tax=Actinacidiphila sp. bgisy144 TaxID=3413791 RepID=UPI003EBC963D